jgi:hypothetical protein
MLGVALLALLPEALEPAPNILFYHRACTYSSRSRRE